MLPKVFMEAFAAISPDAAACCVASTPPPDLKFLKVHCEGVKERRR